MSFLDRMRPRRKPTDDEPGVALRPQRGNRRLTLDEEAQEMERLMRDRGKGTPLLLEAHELPNRLQPIAPELRMQLAATEVRQSAIGALLFEQEQRITAAWADAIEALPGGLRSTIDEAFALLADTEEQLEKKQRRLVDLPSDGDEVWIQRRAQLTSAVEQLEDLVNERRANCVRFCRSAVQSFDQVLAARVAVADQAVVDAELHYADIIARAKAEIGQAKAQRNAIAAVRAQAQSPIEVERHMGRQVSPDPQEAAQAARKSEQEAYARMTSALRSGRSL